MRDHDDTMRYALELDMLERDATLGDDRGTELLRSEFALALNASYLTTLSGGEIHVGAISRSVPQDGVARYEVDLRLQERTLSLSDEQVARLVRHVFAQAQNASHFMRIAAADFTVTLVAREPAGVPAPV